MEIRQSFLITSWDCKWQPLYGDGVEGGGVEARQIQDEKDICNQNSIKGKRIQI